MSDAKLEADDRVEATTKARIKYSTSGCIKAWMSMKKSAETGYKSKEHQDLIITSDAPHGLILSHHILGR